MGLFSRLFGPEPPKTKSHRATSTPADRKAKAEARLKEKELRYLDYLQQNDPATYRDVMNRRLGIRDEKQPDTLQTTLKTLKELKAGGLIDDPRDAGDDNGWLKDLAQGFGAVFGQMLATQQQAQAPREVIRDEAPVDVTAVPSVSQIPAAVRAQAPITARATEPETAPETVPMSLQSRFLVAQFNGKSPEQAAAWLNGQTDERILPLVQALRTVPEDELGAFVHELGVKNPPFAGFVAWLEERWTWFLDAVRELRKLTPEVGV